MSKGGRWQRDTRQAVHHMAKAMVTALGVEAAGLPDERDRKERLQWALRCHDVTRIEAFLRLAQSEPGIATSPEEFDRDPYLFNAANGTIDLRSGTLRAHDPADMLSLISPVPYEPEAASPLWARSLDRWFAGDATLIEFARRWFGYSLTADTREQKLLVAWGAGANGKSTLLEILRHIFGDYARALPFDSLAQRQAQGGAAREDLARLVGSRLVSANEAGAGRRFDEPLLKSLTGGDTVTTRRLYESSTEWHPTFKLAVVCNHKPTVSGDAAVWRRLLLLPFTVVIPAEERDPDLTAKLRAEAPGILRWLVAGCLDWQEHGLAIPGAVRAATETYRQDEDVLGQWVDECTVPDHQARTASRALHESFSSWAVGANEGPLTATAFGRLLTERGITKARKSGFRKGIRLLEGTVGDGLDHFRELSLARAGGESSPKHPSTVPNCPPEVAGTDEREEPELSDTAPPYQSAERCQTT